MLKQELAPRGVGIPVLQGEEEVKTLTPRGAKDVGNLLAGFAYSFGRY